MGRILLTGPFGNVGSNVVQLALETNALLKRNDHPDRITLTCFEKKSKMAEERFQQLKRSKLGREALSDGSLVVVWGDLTNAEDVQRAVKGQDAIIHLGAIIPPLAYTNPDLAYAVNVGGTRKIMEACAQQEGEGGNGRMPRIIYASSYSVHGPSNPNKPVVELRGAASPVNPQDSYGKNKVECEEMLRAEYKGEYCILRLGAITVAIASQANTPTTHEMNVITYGIPANQRRHGVHSKDVARAFLNAARAENWSEVQGKTLMIGGDDSWKITSVEFTNAILNAMGLSFFPELALRRPSPDADGAFYYEDWMDTTEAQALLHFQTLSFQDWKRELRKEVGFLKFLAMRFVAPLARHTIAKKSQHYAYNRSGRKDPNADKTMTQLVLGGE